MSQVVSHQKLAHQPTLCSSPFLDRSYSVWFWVLRSSLTCVFPVPHSAQRWIIRSQTLYPIELRARELPSIAGVSGNDQPIQSMLVVRR